MLLRGPAAGAKQRRAKAAAAGSPLMAAATNYQQERYPRRGPVETAGVCVCGVCVCVYVCVCVGGCVGWGACVGGWVQRLAGYFVAWVDGLWVVGTSSRSYLCV